MKELTYNKICRKKTGNDTKHMNLCKVLLTTGAGKFLAVKYWKPLFLDCNSLWLLILLIFFKLQQHLMQLPKHYMAEARAIFNENIILLFFRFCIYFILKSLTAITRSKLSSLGNSIKYWVSLLWCLLSTLNKWLNVGLKLTFRM